MKNFNVSSKIFFLSLIISALLFTAGCSNIESDRPLFDDKKALEMEQDGGMVQEYSPRLKDNGEKFKIAVIQSDDYPEYDDVFRAFYEGLATIGWIDENLDLSKADGMINRDFIKHLQGVNYSDYIEFSKDDFFSFMADADNASQDEFTDLMERAKNGDIDLVFLMGTLASREVFRFENYKVNTVMDAVADPLGAGFLESPESSGKDFLTGRIDPESYNRQLRLFHDLIGFDTLGVIYEDSMEGRMYGGIDSVENIAKERGFEIFRSHNAMAEPTLEEYPIAFKMFNKALDNIAPDIDAIFLAISGGLESDNVPTVVQKLIDYKLPSFTPEGATNVSRGVLLGVAGTEVGLYNARKAARILNGEKPINLEQRYERMPSISININTANSIGIDFPVEIIRNADEIFVK